MNNNNEIHLAVAFDQNFITPFYVLLTSIFLNNKNNSLVFHVIASEVKESEKEIIIKYVKNKGGLIIFYNLDLSSVNDLALPKNVHFSSATYYRLYFPSLVPKNVSKLLYLDTDIVVIRNLFELYNTNISSNPVGAVKDTADVGIRKDLGIYTKDGYFNAGVLLIDVEKWRAQNISEKALRYIREFPENIKWADQDGLNAILKDNWCRIDKRFNLTYYDIPINLSRKEFRIFLMDKVIIHYTTEQKPWFMLCRNRLRFLYHYYLKKSPHQKKPKYIDWKLKDGQLYKYLKIRIKELLIDTRIYRPGVR